MHLARAVAYDFKQERDKAIADLEKVLELTDDVGLREDAQKVLGALEEMDTD